MISFLAETNFNIYENIILPKNSTLILLRYTHEEVKDTWSKNQDTVPLSHRCDEEGLPGQLGIKLISPSTLYLDSQKPIKVNEDILEILSSLLSNDIHAEYFGLSTNEIRVLYLRLVRRSTVC